MADVRTLGPRLCTLSGGSGVVETVSVTMSWTHTYGRPAPDDPMAFTGWMELKSATREQRVQVYAVDEIQMVGRLTLVGISGLLGECARGGYVLGTPEQPHFTSPYDLLR